VINVWIGQGGDFGVIDDFGGTPAIGSKHGVSTSGGLGDGDEDPFTGFGGGSGGGLTSVQLTGSAPVAFIVPAGGGGTEGGAGDDVASGAGGGATDSNGEDAQLFTEGAGGGAGENGGLSSGVTQGGAKAGTYGTYPAGFTTADGLDGVPANTSATDYTECQGIGGGSVGAGANTMSSGFDAGGDGCVVLRCAAP
jgi:hypothetical protein